MIRNDQNNNEENGLAKFFYEGQDSRFTLKYANLPMRLYKNKETILQILYGTKYLKNRLCILIYCLIGRFAYFNLQQLTSSGHSDKKVA